MKNLFLSAMIIGAAALPLRAADTEHKLITEQGVYQLTPNVKLAISGDRPGGLQFSFEHAYRYPSGGGGSSSYQQHLSQPFVFYWDNSSQTLWRATAKEIVTDAPKPNVASNSNSWTRRFYPNSPNVLQGAPAAFRREVQRLFGSGSSIITTSTSAAR